MVMAMPLIRSEHPQSGTGVINHARTAHGGQVRLGVWIELVTIFWMTIEAGIAIVTGYATHSVSLQGFGIDSIIELIAGWPAAEQVPWLVVG